MSPHRQRRPVIGIPTQTLQSLGGVSSEIPPSWVMSQRYILTLTAAGAIPWMIPLVDEEASLGAVILFEDWTRAIKLVGDGVSPRGPRRRTP